MGNISKNESSALGKYLVKTLCKTHVSTETHSNFVKNLQPSDEHIYIKKSKNKNEPDSAINLFFEIDSLDFSDHKKYPDKDNGWDKKYALTQLVFTILVEKFFHQLRTIQQSGYIVKSFIQTLGYPDRPTVGISFAIQSSKKALSDLQVNIKQFIVDNWSYVKDMKQSNFNKYKKVVLDDLKEEFKNINEEYSFYFSEIMMHRYMFDYNQHMINVVKNIKHKDLAEFYNQYMVDKNRRKLRIVEILSIKKN
jgi:secreted Zn-dependent insulinase-like peptidase